MRRAVIFSTLALLLLAVAGVTVAQEGSVFDAGAQARGTTQVGGSTSPGGEDTSLEGTVPEETAVEEVTQVELPEVDDPVAGRGHQEGEKPNRNPGKPAGEDQNETGPPEQAPVGDESQGLGKGAGRPDHGGRPEGAGKPENSGQGQGGRSNGAERSDGNEGPGGGKEKVTVCHKGKKTLSVGKPAQSAHLRHGDALGTCG